MGRRSTSCGSAPTISRDTSSHGDSEGAASVSGTIIIIGGDTTRIDNKHEGREEQVRLIVIVKRTNRPSYNLLED